MDVNSLQSYTGLIGAIVINIVLSLLVALISLKNILGYGKSFLVCFLAGIVFILLSIPFDSAISTIICAIVFIFLPKKRKPELLREIENDNK